MKIDALHKFGSGGGFSFGRDTLGLRGEIPGFHDLCINPCIISLASYNYSRQLAGLVDYKLGEKVDWR